MKVCSTCCLETHKTHNYERYEQVMEKFVRSIDDDIQPLTSHIECFRDVAAQVEAERNTFLDSVSVVEQKINDRAQQVIESVTLQKSDLLQELQSLKSAAEKEGQFHADAVQLALTEIESFRTSSLELKSKVSPNDITQAAKDVHEKANELLKTHIIPSEYLADECIGLIFWNTVYFIDFSVIHVSQGSVATYVRCGGTST